MNITIYKSIYCTIAVTSLAVTLFSSSCKKVDDHTQFINDQPAFAVGDGVIIKIPPPININSWQFPTILTPGDTATLVGRFFLSKPGLQLKIGNALAKIIYKATLPATTTVGAQPLDVLQFVVSKEMGLGAKIPVQLTANNVTISGPYIEIRQFSGIQGKTDTTLWVDKVVTWKPDNINQYQNSGLPLVNSSCVDAEGNIYFTNTLGVFTVKNGSVKQLLKIGDKFTENGTTFSIRLVLGSVTSFDGGTLNFSASVNEDSPDTIKHYIFRLCKLPINGGDISTINRTLVEKNIGVTNENPTPYEGASNKVKLIALNIKTDINQNLYFRNEFSPEAVGKDNDAWYDVLRSGINNPFDQHSLGNICRISATGSLKSLFYRQFSIIPSDYTPPGLRVDWSADYLISPDGSTAAVINDFSTFTTAGMTIYDLKQDIPLTILKVNQPTFALDGNVDAIISTFLPDGDLLVPEGTRLTAFSWLNLTSYNYSNSDGSGTQTTGRAKNVLFDLNSMLFSGTDRQSNVYYFLNGGQVNSDYANGVNFYKLYSKK